MTGIIIRPGGWDAADGLTRAGFIYRGMTQVEYENTVGAGRPVKSTGAYSHPMEGTNFAEDFATAEDYVDVGRDDPRKTGRPNFVVEVDPRGFDVRKNRQGYFEAFEPIPISAVTRVWQLQAQDDAIVAIQLKKRRNNPSWLALTGAALAGTALGAAATFRGVGGNPNPTTEYIELEEYEGALLLFPVEGSRGLGWAVDQFTGKLGYSHCGFDLGLVDQEGTPLWIDSWAGEGVMLRPPQKFERDPVRIPLTSSEASHARAVALHMLHEKTPYRGRTGGRHCAEFVVACLPKSTIEQRKIPLNATPNDLAVCYGLVDMKKLKNKLLR